MNAPSRYGLTSPAGMEQGRFRIHRDRTGRTSALNGAGNHRLFAGLNTRRAKEARRAHGTAGEPGREASQVARSSSSELTAMIRELARND